MNKKQQANVLARTHTHMQRHTRRDTHHSLPTSLGHLPLLPGEPSAPAHSPPTINTERTCSLLTADVETHPRLPITNSYSHRQQEIASVVFDPNTMGGLHRRTQRPFLANEANNTERERERERSLFRGEHELRWRNFQVLRCSDILTLLNCLRSNWIILEAWPVRRIVKVERSGSVIFNLTHQPANFFSAFFGGDVCARTSKCDMTVGA